MAGETRNNGLDRAVFLDRAVGIVIAAARIELRARRPAGYVAGIRLGRVRPSDYETQFARSCIDDCRIADLSFVYSVMAGFLERETVGGRTSARSVPRINHDGVAAARIGGHIRAA